MRAPKDELDGVALRKGLEAVEAGGSGTTPTVAGLGKWQTWHVSSKAALFSNVHREQAQVCFNALFLATSPSTTSSDDVDTVRMKEPA